MPSSAGRPQRGAPASTTRPVSQAACGDSTQLPSPARRCWRAQSVSRTTRTRGGRCYNGSPRRPCAHCSWRQSFGWCPTWSTRLSAHTAMRCCTSRAFKRCGPAEYRCLSCLPARRGCRPGSSRRNPAGPECWAGHGRVQIGHLHELLPAQSLGRGSDALLVGPDLLDATVDVYSAQIREAVDEMTRDVATRSKVALRPLLCLRGNRNGQRKLRERTPLWPDAPETVQVNALDIVDEIRRQAGEVDTIDHVGPGYTVSKGQQARVANVEQNVLLEQVGKHSRKFRICTTAWSNRADRPAMHNAGRPGPCLRPAGHPGTRGPRVATGRRVGGGAQRPGGACIAGRSSGAGHGTPRHAVSIRRCC